MKIGFYGNANNYPFMLARALHAGGHEILFIVTSRDALNRPECRYDDIGLPYPPWIHDFSSRLRWRYLVPGAGQIRVHSLLNSCDFAVLNEEGPALASRLKVPYLVLLTGSNLEVFADPSKAEMLKPQIFTRSPRLGSICRRFIPTGIIHRWLTLPQRAGIAGASAVAYFARGLIPLGDRLLDEIGVKTERRLFLLMADLAINPYTPPPNNPVLRIFCLARLTWRLEAGSDLTELDYKGSDIMIRGIGLFWRKTKVKIDLRLARKGRHLAETGALVATEGLTEQVTWMDELTQKQVRDEYRAADIVFDQLANGVVAMGGLEAMATGRPLIANARPEIIGPIIGESSPVCQASSATEVCAQLERLIFSLDERVRVGLASRRYVEKYFSAEAGARACLARLTSS